MRNLLDNHPEPMRRIRKLPLPWCLTVLPAETEEVRKIRLKTLLRLRRKAVPLRNCPRLCRGFQRWRNRRRRMKALFITAGPCRLNKRRRKAAGVRRRKAMIDRKYRRRLKASLYGKMTVFPTILMTAISTIPTMRMKLRTMRMQGTLPE